MTSALKRWPGWVLLMFVVVGFLVVGSTRDSGPLTQSDRVDQISRRVACPTCQGESVYESRANASEIIRAEIREQVAVGDLTDDQIIESISDSFGGQVLLVPRATGIDALAWALPATALVIGVAALVVAFRKWQRAAAEAPAVTDDDYELVAQARLEPADDLTDEHPDER